MRYLCDGSLADTLLYLRFNQGEGQEENAIITSTGQFIVAWDFKKVKKGQLDKYEIKKYTIFCTYVSLNTYALPSIQV